jgi:hypothetical protein
MASTQDILKFLSGILSKNAEEKSLNWLSQKTEKIQFSGSPTAFFLSFSQASRFFSKEKLQLDEADKNKADELVAGYEPEFWNVLQTARTYLLLSYPQDKEAWFSAVNQLFETADMHEHQALFAALPLMPFQEDLVDRAIDGCRTNVALIFDSIALNNPYPAKYFPEANWNQMVLKAVFMQRPLYRIQSQDSRSNIALAEIARDFAHERWAAGRNVMPELWRLVSPFLNEKYLEDLQKVMSSKDNLELEGGALALFNGPSGTGKSLLGEFPTLASQIESGEINWEKVGKEYQDTRV